MAGVEVSAKTRGRYLARGRPAQDLGKVNGTHLRLLSFRHKEQGNVDEEVRMLTKVSEALWLLVLTGSLRPAVPQEGNQTEQRAPVFKAETNLVVLDVTVTGKHGQAVRGLKKDDFKIYEDNEQQEIALFSDEQRPVSWGLVLDRSGSMSGMMEEVYNAVLHSVKAGTREDDVFVMTFNQDVQIVQDFTTDRDQLLVASKRLWAMGSTALYDAVAVAADHIRQGRHQKKVLIVVTDGEDNASHIKIERLLDMVRGTDALIYAVGFFSASDLAISKLLRADSEKELKRLAEQTGGLAYFPKNMEECDRACQDIAMQVSRQYSLGYSPKNTAWDGRWRDAGVTSPYSLQGRRRQ